MQFYFLKTRVNLSFSFWAVVTLMLLIDRSNTAILSLISAVLHESGHIFLMYMFSSPPEKLTLGFFGMRIEKRENALSYLQEALVAFAGPCVNLLICLLSFIIYQFCEEEIILRLAFINLLLGAFNLIPIEPLDGARIIKNTLSIFFNEQCIEKILNIFLYIFLSLLFMICLVVTSFYGFNFTLLIFCVYISLCVILKRR